MGCGIAFGAAEARIARVARRGRGLRIAPLTSVALPPGFWQGADGARLEREALNDLASRLGATRGASVSTAEIQCLYQLFFFPRTARENLSVLVPIIVGSSSVSGGGAAASEASALVSDQVLLDGVSPYAHSDLVLVTAAKRAVLERALASLQRVRIRSKEVVPGSIGLHRFTRRFLAEASSGVAAVLAVEERAHEATLILLDDGRLVAARELRVPAGHDSATEAREALDRLTTAIRDALDSLALAVKRPEIASPARILLLGRRGPLGDVISSLRSAGLSGVEIVDVAARLREGGARVDEKEGELPPDPAEFAIPIGLALEPRRSDAAPSLRLRLPRSRRTIASRHVRFDRSVIASAVAAAVVVLLIVLHSAYGLAVQRDNEAALASAVKSGLRLESQILGIQRGQKALCDELQSLHSRACARAVDTRFRAILDRAPDSVKITAIDLKAAEGELLPDVAVASTVRGVVQGREGDSETALTEVLRRYVEALEQATGSGTVTIKDARPHKDFDNVEVFELRVAAGGRR